MSSSSTKDPNVSLALLGLDLTSFDVGDTFDIAKVVSGLIAKQHEIPLTQVVNSLEEKVKDIDNTIQQKVILFASSMYILMLLRYVKITNNFLM